jgi:hypothetical protein
MPRHSPRLLALIAGLALSTHALAQAPSTRLPSPLAPAPGAQAAPPAPPALDEDALPITRLTLYRSGVAAFERRGTITGQANFSLSFDSKQLNDILKSLQLLDLDGGRIDSVTYASKDPLAKRLEAFGVPIGDSPSLPALLGRLRGSALAIAIPGERIEGTILSVETRRIALAKGSEPVDEPFLNLVTDAGLRSIPISAVSTFTLKDAGLNRELTGALAALAGARNDRRRSLDLSLSGEGDRRVVVRYVHEAPVWKSSYRLIIPDAAPGQPDAPLTLQGWAIVENTSDTDWRNVRLSLVSNRPISFTMDLAEPLYIFRTDVPVPVLASAMPREFAPSSPAPASAAQAIGRRADREAAQSGVARSRANLADSAEMAALSADELVNFGPAALARGGSSGEVFFYEVENPVSVPRQRSAMIPFLTTQLPGRRVSVFNPADGLPNPLRGLQITNSSSLQILPGPISVYDQAAYAGDSQIGQVAPGEKRLLAYAVDLELSAALQTTETSSINRLRIIDGSFEQTITNQLTTTYTFSSRDAAKGRTLILEHTRRPGFTLESPKQPADTTPELYRFEQTLNPSAAGELKVVESRVESTRLGITSISLPNLLSLAQQGKASPAVVALFKDLAERQSAVTDAQKRLAEADRQLAQNTAEQERISRTMAPLPQNSEVYQGYLRDLATLNTALKTLRSERTTLASDLAAREADLNNALRNAKAD